MPVGPYGRVLVNLTTTLQLVCYKHANAQETQTQMPVV